MASKLRVQRRRTLTRPDRRHSVTTTDRRMIIELIITKSPGIFSLSVGLWAFASGFIFGVVGNYPGADWNTILVGFGMMAFASVWISVREPHPLLSWILLILAVWLVCSAFLITVQGYPAFTWNQIVCGILAAVGALWSLT